MSNDPEPSAPPEPRSPVGRDAGAGRRGASLLLPGVSWSRWFKVAAFLFLLLAALIALQVADRWNPPREPAAEEKP